MEYVTADGDFRLVPDIVPTLMVQMEHGAHPLTKAYPDDAGYDLAVKGYHALQPGEAKDLPTGLRIALPPWTYARITGRSSAYRKRRLFVHEGIIDPGYRGELFMFVRNDNPGPVIVGDGDRLGQLILAPVIRADVEEVENLPESPRGANGFGSSGGHRTHSVYLGFPIDASRGDPDFPHQRWQQAGGGPAFCPYCVQQQFPLERREAIARNMAALDSADRVVFYLTPDDVSFGVPVELYRAAEQDAKRVAVIGQMPPGLFRNALRDAGVREFGDTASFLVHDAIYGGRGRA